jgi:protein-disulfide isomerase
MRWREAVETASIAALAVCAIAATGMMIHQQFFTPTAGTSLTPSKTANWKQFVDGNMTIGAASSAVTIVEFSDFECPFCRAFYDRIEPHPISWTPYAL